MTQQLKTHLQPPSPILMARSSIVSTSTEDRGHTVQIELVRGDITKLSVDAIVNAANSELRGGGGVDGAIHAAAGPELMQDSLALGGCRTGDAKATPGFKLSAKWVFHAVGPVWWDGSRGEEAALACCYRRSLELAATHHVKSIAFPAISTGVYGFPRERAAEIAVRAVKAFAEKCEVERVLFCCFDEETATIYKRLLAKPLATASRPAPASGPRTPGQSCPSS